MRSAALLLILFAVTAQAELPAGAKDLLGKLEAFEAQALKPAQEQIAGARKQAAALLEAEMVSATRAGDLEGALAIKQEMERLQRPVSVQVVEGEAPAEAVAETTPEPTTITESQPVGSGGGLLEELNNTLWERNGDTTFGVVIKDGKWYIYHRENKNLLGAKELKETRRNKFEITHNNGSTEEYTVSRDRKTIDLEHGQLTYVGPYED